MSLTIESEGWFVSQHTQHPPRWWVVDENHDPLTGILHETQAQALAELEALRNVGYVPVKIDKP